jgi:hypothetical protein
MFFFKKKTVSSFLEPYLNYLRKSGCEIKAIIEHASNGNRLSIVFFHPSEHITESTQIDFLVDSGRSCIQELFIYTIITNREIKVAVPTQVKKSHLVGTMLDSRYYQVEEVIRTETVDNELRLIHSFNTKNTNPTSSVFEFATKLSLHFMTVKIPESVKKDIFNCYQQVDKAF